MKYMPLLMIMSVLVMGTLLFFVSSSLAGAGQASDLCTISKNYPASIRQWCSLIEKNARQYGLEAKLVAAVMLLESNGDAQAYSQSGAVGLMQVMPRDGLAANFLCQAGPCFSDRPTSNELYRPETNVSYACQLLKDLSKKFGNLREALKAYGPMDVGYSYADRVLQIAREY